MEQVSDIVWFPEPQKHDYPAAKDYLFLLFSDSVAKKLVKKLLKGDMLWFKAKDIFRAAEILHPLGDENKHVKRNLLKIKNKQSMSPILLVRDSEGRKLIIADGFHRLCAVYLHSEDEIVPVKIISL